MGEVSIRFFLDGEQFAARAWRHVPRAGDEIMLGPDDKKTAYRVERVVWGVESSDEKRMKWQAVNVEIEKINS